MKKRLIYLSGNIKEKFEDYILFVYSFVLFNVKSLARMHRVYRVMGYTFEQMYVMGVESIRIITVSSVFIGAVTAWTAAYYFSDYIPAQFVGTAVGKSVATELGPVLTAFVFAGRAGSGIASAVSSMKVNEQISAYRVLSLDPFEYLVVPRVYSGLIMLPVLTLFADLISILGAGVTAYGLVGVEPHVFIEGIKFTLESFDIYFGLIKAVIFGYLIALVGCFYGFNAEGGAKGAGLATKKAVINVSVLILLVDAAVWIIGR